jgi:hypothetical protein
MTLDESTSLLRAAAQAADFPALQQARLHRDAAIAALATLPPTAELRASVADSIAAGEEARRALRLIKQRLHDERRRLATIEAGFLRALRIPETPHFDYKG